MLKYYLHNLFCSDPDHINFFLPNSHAPCCFCPLFLSFSIHSIDKERRKGGREGRNGYSELAICWPHQEVCCLLPHVSEILQRACQVSLNTHQLMCVGKVRQSDKTLQGQWQPCHWCWYTRAVSPLFVWLTGLIMTTKTKTPVTTYLSFRRGLGSVMVQPWAAWMRQLCIGDRQKQGAAQCHQPHREGFFFVCFKNVHPPDFEHVGRLVIVGSQERAEGWEIRVGDFSLSTFCTFFILYRV